MSLPAVVLGVTADGRTVAEAEVADTAGAVALIAFGKAAPTEFVWAHSHADLEPLGFRRQWGYRRLEGAASHSRAAGNAHGQAAEVVPVSADEESAELWAAAFSGQWGHKRPVSWPPDLPAGTRTLGLRRAGAITGVCRFWPATGLIDAPGLMVGYRDERDYQMLLVAALRAVRTESVTVESWGDPPDRVGICERLGLVTVEYIPGWEQTVVADADG